MNIGMQRGAVQMIMYVLELITLQHYYMNEIADEKDIILLHLPQIIPCDALMMLSR